MWKKFEARIFIILKIYRYLEEAIINLNTADQITRAHLPLVVGEVRRHLFKFIKWYPSHVASRRINLIIMAATNLLNYL